MQGHPVGAPLEDCPGGTIPAMDGSDILRDLEDTQFPQKLRGYDPAQVDALIDRAVREIADLRAERRTALDRAEMAEKRIDQELDATQRARATAEAEIATAEAEGRRYVAEAEAEAATLRSAAETEVRAAIEAARHRLLDETTSLEAARDAVRDDISIMERHVDAHRERLLSTLGDLRKLVEATPGRPLAEKRPSREARRPPEPSPRPNLSKWRLTSRRTPWGWIRRRLLQRRHRRPASAGRTCRRWPYPAEGFSMSSDSRWAARVRRWTPSSPTTIDPRRDRRLGASVARSGTAPRYDAPLGARVIR